MKCWKRRESMMEISCANNNREIQISRIHYFLKCLQSLRFYICIFFFSFLNFLFSTKYSPISSQVSRNLNTIVKKFIDRDECMIVLHASSTYTWRVKDEAWGWSWIDSFRGKKIRFIERKDIRTIHSQWDLELCERQRNSWVFYSLHN